MVKMEVNIPTGCYYDPWVGSCVESPPGACGQNRVCTKNESGSCECVDLPPIALWRLGIEFGTLPYKHDDRTEKCPVQCEDVYHPFTQEIIDRLCVCGPMCPRVDSCPEPGVTETVVAQRDLPYRVWLMRLDDPWDPGTAKEPVGCPTRIVVALFARVNCPPGADWILIDTHEHVPCEPCQDYWYMTFTGGFKLRGSSICGTWCPHEKYRLEVTVHFDGRCPDPPQEYPCVMKRSCEIVYIPTPPDGWRGMPPYPEGKCVPIPTQPSPPPACSPGDKKYYTCPDGSKVEWCTCNQAGQWECIENPEEQCPSITPECTPGDKKDYICPDGTPVPWCICDQTGRWVCKINPELECPTCTPGEKKDYVCPDGTTVPWCVCVGSDDQGFWRCIPNPEDQCPATPSPGPGPGPGPGPSPPPECPPCPDPYKVFGVPVWLLAMLAGAVTGVTVYKLGKGRRK